MSLNVKLLASFGAVTVAMVLLGAYLITEIKAASDNTTALYEEDYLPASQSMDIESDVLWANVAVQRYVEAQDAADRPDARALFDESRTDIEANFAAIAEAADPAEDEALTTFDDSFTQLVGMWEDAMALADAGEIDAAEEIEHEQAVPVMQAALDAINVEIDHNDAEVAAKEAESNEHYAQARNLSIGLLIVAAIVVPAGAWWLARSISGRVGGSARAVTGSAGELASVSSEMSATAEETAAQTVATAVEEMSASIREIAQQAGEAARITASAVEEQTATTNEISRNVSEAARGSADIAENVTAVAQAAQNTAAAAGATQQTAVSLGDVAADLQAVVDGGGHDRTDPPSRTGGTPTPVAAPAGAGA
jgi:methyl-accepting chemotaxis protein